MKERRKRSILKALSWRATATLTTIIVVFLFTGELLISLGVGAVEVFAKLALYYCHERAWNRVLWGKRVPEPGSKF